MSRLTFSPIAIQSVFWLGSGFVVLFIFAAGIVFTPWYISLTVFAVGLLGTVILFKPAWGLYLLVLLVPVTPFSVGFILVAPWNYVLSNRYADKIPLFTPVVLMTVAGVLFVKFASIKRIDIRDPLLLPSLLLLMYAAVSLTWSNNLGHSIFELAFFQLNFFVYLAIVSLVRNKDDYQYVMWAWILSMTIQSVIAVGLFAYKSIDSIYQLLPNFLFQFKVYGGVLLKTGAPNAAAGLQDFHETSLLTNMAAALAFGMLLNQKKKGMKFLTLFIAFLFFLFITLRTESRAGIGSMLVMLTMLALLMPQLTFYRIRTVVILILCVGSIYSLTHFFLHTVTEVHQPPRMVMIVEKIIEGGKLIDTAHKEKKEGRVYMYKNSFDTFFANDPICGLGIGNLKYLLKIPHAHSVYFSLILDFGLAGCVFLALLAKILFQRFYLVKKLPDSCSKTMALAATAGLVGAAVHCLADFEYRYTSVWLLLGFVMSSYNVALSPSLSNKKLIEGRTSKRITMEL